MSEFNSNFDRDPNTPPTKETVMPGEPLPTEPVTNAPLAPPPKKNTLANELLDYLEVIVIAICVVVFLFSFVFRLCRVSGKSMEDTLFNGESLIISDLFYTPEREDIIVFHQTGDLNEAVVKRVIATEGETVHIHHDYHTMVITITDTKGNKTVVEEDYIKYDGYPLYLNDMTVTVPEGHLFVLGDNRNDSKDSRHADIGMVDERRVLGKVLFRLTPFSRFGAVN